MKKSLLALAVLGMFAGAASAQSSVTIYGKLDQGLAKQIGSKDKEVRDAAGSRLGFRGQEDLGNGLSAVFTFEHRFDPDTGAQNSAAFWHGQSWVGLRSGFGQLTLGRHYTAAYSEIQNAIEPFGGDTVAALRNSSITPSTAPAGATGFAAALRVANSVRYELVQGGLKVAATVAEKTGGTDRPWSVAGSYSAGPLFVGAGYEDPSDEDDRILTVGARYTVGPATLRAGFSDARNTNDEKVRGYAIGANVTAGPGQVLVGYGTSKNRTTSTNLSKKFGIGYRYPLSKRTFLYTDFARDSVPTSNKTGYDLGLQHNF